jgi:hypothetical protein
MSRRTLLVVAVPVMAIALGGVLWWWASAETECLAMHDSPAVEKALEAAALAATALKQAQMEQLIALKELDRMRDAVKAARTTGDATRLRDAEDAARGAEFVAREKATLVARREAEGAIAQERAKEAWKFSSKKIAGGASVALSCKGNG